MRQRILIGNPGAFSHPKLHPSGTQTTLLSPTTETLFAKRHPPKPITSRDPLEGPGHRVLLSRKGLIWLAGRHPIDR